MSQFLIKESMNHQDFVPAWKVDTASPNPRIDRDCTYTLGNLDAEKYLKESSFICPLVSMALPIGSLPNRERKSTIKIAKEPSILVSGLKVTH